MLREIFENNHESIEIKADAKVAYLSQLHGETLNDSNTIMDEFIDAGFKTYDEIRAYLANYDFEGEILDQLIDDKRIRKMSMRKFRQMIYASHFNRDYLETEQKKKSVEMKIELALKDNNFELAKRLVDELGGIIKLL